jgi:predicted glycoside hydrolase/deacetylase ChbG (UPF0249 family)
LDILHELEDVRQKRSSALFRSIEFCLKVITGKISPNKVSQDWEAQVEKFQEIVGQYPDGINSHEHVHFFPPFFKVALKLKNKYAIPFIRFGDTAKLENPSMVAYIIHIMRIIDRKMFKKNTFMTTSSLVSLDWIKDVESFSKSSKKGDVEIVCHPEIAKDFSHIQRYF